MKTFIRVLVLLVEDATRARDHVPGARPALDLEARRKLLA